MTIPRKPVGFHSSNSIKHTKHHSLASSSIYSEPAELDIPRTNFSAYSLESIQLDDDDDDNNDNNDTPPQLPPKEDQSPPVPSKDGRDSVTPPPIPQKDAARPEVTAFRLAENHVVKPEIWKRRSTRSNSDLSFEDLKLKSSNGSTANSPPRQVQPPPDRSLPPIPNNEKKLPPPRPPPQQDYISSMGQKNSKLRKKESYGASASPSNLPGRLPTPDYHKTDYRVPHTPSIISPQSPVSPESPDLPSFHQSPIEKVKGIFKTASSPNLPQVQIHKSLDSDLTFEHSRSSSDTLTIVAPTESTIFTAPQPQKANAAARILTPQPSPPVAITVRSPPQTPKSPFSARAFAFQNANTIHPGPTIDVRHYDCYQKHRFMRPSRNDKCPLGCMVCDKRDTEKRWSCTWCCLRICTKCMEILAANGKDLKICVDKVGKGVGPGERAGVRSDRSERAG